MKYFAAALIVLISLKINFSQENNLQLGKPTTAPSAAVFDLSDPMGINMEVSLWGFVRYPGKYKVPVNTTIMDLLSYAGGPMEESDLKEIRILRGVTDTTVKAGKIMILNYNDLLWEDKIHMDRDRDPILRDGDFVVVMKDTKYSFRDNLLIVLPLISTVITIITFIITLRK